jgi:hypothetical protein
VPYASVPGILRNCFSSQVGSLSWVVIDPDLLDTVFEASFQDGDLSPFSEFGHHSDLVSINVDRVAVLSVSSNREEVTAQSEHVKDISQLHPIDFNLEADGACSHSFQRVSIGFADDNRVAEDSADMCDVSPESRSKASSLPMSMLVSRSRLEASVVRAGASVSGTGKVKTF